MNGADVQTSIPFCVKCGSNYREPGGSYFCRPCKEYFGRRAAAATRRPPEGGLMSVPMVMPVREYVPPSDPRGDLFIDSDYWRWLLEAAYKISGDDTEGLFWALEATRCLGASLTIVDGKARIRRGEMSEEEYERVRRDWLMPRMAELRPLLETPDWVITY